MIPRRALVNFLLSMAEKPGMAASDTHLAVTTTSFDISILEFLLPLVRGAQIVIATAEQSSDARELQRLLRQHAVTVMQATPTTWRMLLESGWEGKSDLRILCGGEALTADLARQLLPRCRELWNMYGPTETTIWSSTERITSADHISLGSPDCQHAIPCSRRKPKASFFGHARRALDWRHGLGSRLSQASRVDRTEVRDRSHQQESRCTSLPHRRRGPLPPRWLSRVSGTSRPAGEAPRFSHRTGRDRERARQNRWHFAGRGYSSRGSSR